MQSQQDAGKSKSGEVSAVSGGTKLKSERVQWHLQLPGRERRKFQAAIGGGVKIAGPLTLSFDLVVAGQAVPEGGGGAEPEAEAWIQDRQEGGSGDAGI